MQRWIIHIDMDAFFASVEQRDHPGYRGQPVIVGGLGLRGVVSTASYEARAYGVHSAMPMAKARRLCPQGIFLAGNYEQYSKVSKEIRAIFDEFTPLVEPLSIDEAFLDVTGMMLLFSDPVEIARRIKDRIKAELSLTASAGVAANKFLAKLASDLKKPDGLVVIYPGQHTAVLKNLPIGRLWGVGEVMSRQLIKQGIQTIGQLASADVSLLERFCGKEVYDLQRLALGQDDRPVMPDCQPKSIGREITYEHDLFSAEEIETQWLLLAEKVGWRLRRAGLSARTITVKIRFASFKTITRSRTFSEPCSTDERLFAAAKTLSAKVSKTESIRLLGITASKLTVGEEISLFSNQDTKRNNMYQAVDKLRLKFGEGVITKVRLLNDRKPK
ncbi:MAG: DNA polymerase IV [Pelosinus sp.]|nr:DNA polymerase IV [Pelosinus sp.]